MLCSPLSAPPSGKDADSQPSRFVPSSVAAMKKVPNGQGDTASK